MGICEKEASTRERLTEIFAEVECVKGVEWEDFAVGGCGDVEVIEAGDVRVEGIRRSGRAAKQRITYERRVGAHPSESIGGRHVVLHRGAVRRLYVRREVRPARGAVDVDVEARRCEGQRRLQMILGLEGGAVRVRAISEGRRYGDRRADRCSHF